MHLLGSPVGVVWLPYTVMRFLTCDDCQRTLGEAKLHDERLQRIVTARGLTLRLLLVPHSAILPHSSQQRTQFAVSVGFPARALSPPPQSEHLRRPISFALPAIGYPTLQSFSLVAHEIIHTSCRPPQGNRQVTVCVALHSP